jgi:hypothetical protein
MFEVLYNSFYSNANTIAAILNGIFGITDNFKHKYFEYCEISKLGTVPTAVAHNDLQSRYG